MLQLQVVLSYCPVERVAGCWCLIILFTPSASHGGGRCLPVMALRGDSKRSFLKVALSLGLGCLTLISVSDGHYYLLEKAQVSFTECYI